MMISLEDILGLIFIVLLLFLLIKISIKQINWLFFKTKVSLDYEKKIQNILLEKKLKVIHIYEPDENIIKNYSFSNNKHISFCFGTSSIMGVEKTSYRVVIYQEKNIKKEVWVKIIDCAFLNTKYFFDW